MMAKIELLVVHFSLDFFFQFLFFPNGAGLEKKSIADLGKYFDVIIRVGLSPFGVEVE